MVQAMSHTFSRHYGKSRRSKNKYVPYTNTFDSVEHEEINYLNI